MSTPSLVRGARALAITPSQLRTRSASECAADGLCSDLPAASRGAVGSPWEEPPVAGSERTLTEVFTETVASFPTSTALDASDATLTYEGLSDEVEKLAARLSRWGSGREIAWASGLPAAPRISTWAYSES